MSAAQRCAAELASTVYCNPHSVPNEADGGPACRYIQSAREKILALFGTTEEHYCVVFTVRCAVARRRKGGGKSWRRQQWRGPVAAVWLLTHFA